MKRFAFVALALLAASPLAAQGRGPKRYAVSEDRAVSVTREVLTHQGFEVVRIEQAGPDQIVWYRRGNMGRGKGKGPPVRMVIRRDPVHKSVVFLETPGAILADIEVRLK
ncbi:MAG TPA: hypothetical protein VNH63_10390 [Gemmatimonadales bacterium]|nr:hypothetical protein [Gemmatimonadales bacterium]